MNNEFKVGQVLVPVYEKNANVVQFWAGMTLVAMGCVKMVGAMTAGIVGDLTSSLLNTPDLAIGSGDLIVVAAFAIGGLSQLAGVALAATSVRERVTRYDVVEVREQGVK